MQANQDPQPLWYVIWRKIIWFVLALILPIALLSLPVGIANHQIPANASRLLLLESIVDNISILNTAFFKLAVYLWIGAVIVGITINLWAHHRFKIWQRVEWHSLVARAVLVLIAWIVFVFSDVSVGEVFIPDCRQVARLVGFVDSNRNGIRDVEEPGLPNVTGTVTIAAFKLSKMGEQIFSFKTDDQGYALATNELWTTCNGGEIIIKFDIPDGYTPTTDITIGPIGKASRDHWGPIVIYAGFRPK